MSEIKVNKISPKQTCTQLTLGDSGDTIIIPSGATITNNGTATGFGATYNGAVNWSTTVQTSNFNAVSGNGYFVNTTSGQITVTLPATPSAGSIVAVTDYAGTAATNKITIARNGSKVEGVNTNAGITVNRDSITLVYIDSTQGWLPVNESSGSNLLAAYVAATGGTVTTCGDYKIHAFTGSGCFVVTCAGNSQGSNTIQTMIVAGGGSGGARYGGGGGGGGMVLTPPAGVPVTATTYPVTIGGGGTGSPNPTSYLGTSGNPSVFNSLTAVGGGKGEHATPAAPGGSGGGSGQGGSAGSGTQPSQPGNSGTYGFGNPAGNGYGAPGYGHAGGGGAGGVGGTGPGPTGPGGNGGNGKDVTPLFGAAPKPFYGPTNGVYAGGGGGGSFTAGVGSGGPGGGGSGGNPGNPGTVNTGGGAGGSTGNTQCAGGNGGSGVVLIRYKYQ